VTRTRVVAAALAAALSATAAPAQAPAPAAQAGQAPGAPGAPAPGSGTDTVRSILNQEFEAAPGTYTYDPQGRRDPFVSLLKRIDADTGPKTRPPGIKGFLIQEVALKGIVKTPKGFTAMLLGTDGKSYFVTTGDRLFDGQITAVDAITVTFRQEVTDPLSTVKSREVKKTLYPSEEAR
jgi:Tfp pilus assembly protein PilP